MTYTIAPNPMIRNKKYPADVVPMYRMPFRSDDVYAQLKNGDVVIAAFNHFSSRWVLAETSEDISDEILCWWGPVE